MTSPAPRIWFVTGASRGLGAEIVRAVLAAGDRVVATARNRQALVDSLGPDGDNLLSLSLDVTRPDQAQAAVDAALARFGRIDVLVNNAGYGNLSLFEESTAQDVQAQYDTNVFGLMHVTRAVLPAMRAQRSGRIFNISSIGGIVGGESGALYCASKFAVEGFSESLAGEVRRFGIHVTIVEPGFFRTDFLEPTSVRHGSHAIADYAQVAADLKAFYDSRSRNQAGDPARLGQALMTLASVERPPVRWCAGSDALGIVQAKIDSLQGELDAWRDLSASTDGEFEFKPEAETTMAWR
ncbi:short-chain dehydrogenase/reductase [Caulobacter flavus]|uniref:Short-chain dehydrogenase/reductase n=1 Tax=Caulobacter flavus TaxID=1679497 RepID=A0A2N5CMB0_9CAUL|nr:oxidoreductase [Caulobacter flavus]AYV44780.1 short-chain dehydrogenase/reductase [Caulobacter flavus]PLR07121.1 short-chain dehydrogenase/reductase [Caulobacter flavus]